MLTRAYSCTGAGARDEGGSSGGAAAHEGGVLRTWELRHSDEFDFDTYFKDSRWVDPRDAAEHALETRNGSHDRFVNSELCTPYDEYSV